MRKVPMRSAGCWSIWRAALAVSIASSVAACAGRPTQEAIATYSAALDTTSTSARQGLFEIQKRELATINAKNANAILSAKPGNAHVELEAKNEIVTNDVLKPRLEFFVALSDYASALAAAASPEQATSVKVKIEEAGKAFGALGVAIRGDAANFPAEKVNSAATAFASIAAILVDAKLNHEIPKIVSSTHENLKAGVEAFKADLGDPSAGGFRALMNDATKRLVGQETILIGTFAQDVKSIGKPRLHDEIRESQGRIQALGNADMLLTSLVPALDEMLEAHEALRTPSVETTLSQVNLFLDRAEDLREAVNTFRAK
ncbi:hypothetical protein HUE56_04415 (plasmid) [Azospirillum oryzae]|uniref:Uncharacterized protein n=1 Tax=Azospirillum oryzae TaxID=286727 RepID=A0A6N1AKS9_9PROT|nr:hypothetical protein [Azospirillum oryzae]KAA0585663.1 hypothetical protein FZ938_25380 [Azospirillum oryzae]QKS49784.1 hypothetical protein HUE56_04415 [Azospirillum oryzae]GLR79042.1 hypothetical protein GCM10007856_17160 [Azospirillum oryzae]